MEYKILLVPDAKSIQQKTLHTAIEHRLDDSQSLKDRLARLKALNEGRQLAAQHVETIQRR